MDDLFDAIEAWIGYGSIEVAWRTAAEEVRGLAMICSDRGLLLDMQDKVRELSARRNRATRAASCSVNGSFPAHAVHFPPGGAISVSAVTS